MALYGQAPAACDHEDTADEVQEILDSQSSVECVTQSLGSFPASSSSAWVPSLAAAAGVSSDAVVNIPDVSASDDAAIVFFDAHIQKLTRLGADGKPQIATSTKRGDGGFWSVSLTGRRWRAKLRILHCRWIQMLLPQPSVGFASARSAATALHRQQICQRARR